VIFLILLSFQLNQYAISNSGFQDDSVISDQLNNYLLEFEREADDFSSWFIFEVLNSIEESEHIYTTIVTNNNILFPNSYANIKCIDKQRSINPNLDFVSLYVLCNDNNSLKIAYLYSTDNSYASHSVIINSLHADNLTLKQRYHFDQITNSKSDIDYYIAADKIDILDIYFVDKYDLKASSFSLSNLAEKLKLHTSNLSELNTLYDKYLFIFSINLFFKLEMEYDVYNTSKVIVNYDDLPISKLYLRILSYISYSSYINGYYQYDIDLHRNYIIPVTSYLSSESFVKATIDYGVSLYRIGNTTASLNLFQSLFEDSLLISDIYSDRYYTALLNNLAIAYLNVGFFEKYIQLQLKALKYSEEFGEIDQQVYILNNLYIYHRRIQNWSIAIDYLHKVKSRVTHVDDNTRLAEVELAFGTFHRDYTRDYSLSSKHLNNSLELARAEDSYEATITALIELGLLYNKTNNIDKSYNYFLLASDLAENKNDEWMFVYSNMKLADIHLDKGNIQLANTYLEHVIDYDKTRMNFRNQVDRKTIISKKLILDNNKSEAFRILRNYADDILKRAIHSSDIQSGHIYLETEFLALFELFIKNLVNNSFLHESIYWMDEIKNLSSVSFYNNPALKSSILSENELVLDFALRNRIERLRSELRMANPDQRVQLNNLLLEAISEQNSLRRKVLQNIDFEPVNLNRLRRQLGRSDLILYFSVFNEDLYISTISSGSFNIHRVTFSDKDLYRVEQIVNSLSSDRVKLTELAWLKSKLFDGIEVSDRYTNYYIIPDGFLYHIPFEILPVDNVASDYSYGKATYLIERASISYSNSLKDLKTSLSHRPQRNYALDFVGFGITHFNNPESQLLPGRYLPALPLAEKEVKEISTILSSLKNNVYLDSETATERRFREKTGNSRILHFASHSEVFENDPLYSVIYLNQEMDESENRSGDANSDGFVYAYELFQLDLTSEMVMMNSCESGSGNYIQGSGIVGFSRAFNYAGVPTLVMNLWSVRDRSAYHLSVSFYEYLNQGYSKNEAMQKAKIDYINKHNSNPTNWGSFVIYGNIDPIVPSRTPWIAALVLIFIASVSLIVAWFRLPGKIKSRLQ
jgi:CHAT domain-containing protein